MQAGPRDGRLSSRPRREFIDVNGDGRADLYVANDEDPNQLYVNVPWPGGAKRRPGRARLPLRGARSRGGRRRPVRRHGRRDRRHDGRPPQPLRDQLAARAVGGVRQQTASGRSRTPGRRFDPALGSELRRLGHLVGRPREHRQARPRPDRRRDPRDEPDSRRGAGARPGTRVDEELERFGNAKGGSAAPRALRLNGRGLAAADVDNDGRMDIAINTIGGKLVLLRPIGTERPLARREPDTIHPRRRRHGRRCRTAGASSGRSRREAAISHPRIRASTSASEPRRRSLG